MNVNFKILLIFAFLATAQVSFAQDYKSSTESIKNIDTQISNESFDSEEITAEKLIFTIKEGSTQDTASEPIDDEEWLIIEQEIQKNKSKISANKDYIHTSRVMDTVYLDVPVMVTKSQLSGW